MPFDRSWDPTIHPVSGWIADPPLPRYHVEVFEERLLNSHDPPASSPEEGDASRGDWIRRLAYLGIGTLFLTQEAASRLVRELKLPGQASQILLREIERNKEEFFRILREVLLQFLEGLEIKPLLKERLDTLKVEEILSSLLKDLKVEVRAEIRFHDPGNPPSDPPSAG